MRNAVRFDMPWLAASLTLVCVVIAMLPESTASGLALERQALLGGEFWRLWTGHLVHFSQQQMWLDTTVLFLVGALAENELGSRKIGMSVMLGLPLISCGLLLLVPALDDYRGASGFSILLAVAVGFSLWEMRPTLRKTLLVLGTCLFIKTMMEAFGYNLDLSGLPSGVVVAWQAHLLGALGGWLLFTWRIEAHAFEVIERRIQSGID